MSGGLVKDEFNIVRARRFGRISRNLSISWMSRKRRRFTFPA